MNAPVSPTFLLDAIKSEREKRRAEESFAEFAKQAWHILEPATELKWGWGLDAICEHLEAVHDGEITRLLMNVPPGSMKSLLTNVLFPAWEWGPANAPHLRFLATAHKEPLAVRDNLKCRRLIQSDWYQDRWPVKLVGDQNAKSKFENDKTGFREAMPFKSMTGSRGDRVTLDDPLSVDGARSDADIEACANTFREALPTRVNNDKSAIIVIMQRLHERDTSGIILAEKLPYVHLCLPMRFEPERRCMTSIGFVDPRKKAGELFFPERFPEESVAELEKILGKYATAGQLQQRPDPAEGGILDPELFSLWPAKRGLPTFDYVVQSYDTAFEPKEQADPSAFMAWGVFTHKGKRGAMLLDVWAEHLAYPDLRKKVLKEWHTRYGVEDNRTGRKTDVVLVEKKASGQSLLQDLKAGNVPTAQFPFKGMGNISKSARAHLTAPILELGCLYLLESSKEEGEPVFWARDFLRQLRMFPNGEHDDMVDTFTQAMIYLRDNNWFELDAADIDEVEDHDYTADKKKQNPYLR